MGRLLHATGPADLTYLFPIEFEPDPETRRFFDTFQQIEAQRPAFDRTQLFTALGGALEAAGHLRLVKAQPSHASGDWLSGIIIVPVVFWGLGAALGIALGLPPLPWLGLAAGIALAYGITVAAADKLASVLAMLVLGLWVGAGVVLVFADPSQLIWTHGLPVLAAFLLAFTLKRLRLREARDIAFALTGVARSTPYVAPVVLIAVLLPALTADVWQLAAKTHVSNLLGAAVLSVGVLVVLVGRQLRRELEPVLTARSRWLATRATAPEMTRRALDGASNDASEIIEELPSEVIADAWPASGDEYAPYLVATAGDSLRQPLAPGLVLTVAVIAGFLALYLYALLAVTVPVDVAARWAGTAIPQHEVGLWIITLEVPGGPFVAMAGLLGVFATAIFLAFALTEERVAAALTEALLRDPIDRFLVLAVPFVGLIDRMLTNPDDFYSPEVSDDDSSDDSSEAEGDELST